MEYRTRSAISPEFKDYGASTCSPAALGRVAKSDRTHAAILDSAFKLIWSYPFRDMTVKSLMSQTGTGRPTFYRYFRDLHEVMEALLEMLQGEIFSAAEPWLAGVGDPVALIHETLNGLVRVCYQRGPFIPAISDAATTDKRFEHAWKQFIAGFDDAAREREDTHGLSITLRALEICLKFDGCLDSHQVS